MFNFFLFICFPPIKLKKNDVKGDKRGKMRATKVWIVYLWPCEYTGVRQCGATFLT